MAQEKIHRIGGVEGTVKKFATLVGVSETTMRCRIWKWQKGRIDAAAVLDKTLAYRGTGGNDEWRALSERPRKENLKMIPELTPFERRM